VDGVQVHQEGRPQPAPHGRAVQVDPIKPPLKAPGSKRLKLINDGPLSNVAFTFRLRRYSTVFVIAAVFTLVCVLDYSVFGRAWQNARNIFTPGLRF